MKKKLTVLSVFAAVLFVLPGIIFAGNLEPTAAPSDAGSAMYTLEDIYNYLDTGVAGTKRSGGFTEPSAAPGSTGHTLDEINTKITEKCITCEGTLNGTRWCDQGDGTVKDMTTGLVWLKKADWGGQYPFWVDTMNDTNAHDRAAQLWDGSPNEGSAGLSDDSEEGDWRLPTKKELYGLANGTEAVRSNNVRAFTGLQSYIYWSSTTYASDTDEAWRGYMGSGYVSHTLKDIDYFYVWPVRSDN